MNKNLNQKLLLIFAVLVIFIYGIFGIPSGVTGKALLDAMGKRIHLGLDLRGGVHLILKVNGQEAVATETDNTVGSVQQDLKTANLGFTQVYKPDPTKPEVVKVEGVSPANASAVRTALARVGWGGVAPDLERPHLASAREFDAVNAALRALDAARETLRAGEPVDLIVGDLQEAYAALGHVSGDVAAEEVLSGVFSRFCIGK